MHGPSEPTPRVTNDRDHVRVGTPRRVHHAVGDAEDALEVYVVRDGYAEVDEVGRVRSGDRGGLPAAASW